MHILVEQNVPFVSDFKTPKPIHSDHEICSTEPAKSRGFNVRDGQAGCGKDC